MIKPNIINISSEKIDENTVFLIDTNVLSELMREKPNYGVIDFFSKNHKMVISAVTIQELFFGYVCIPDNMTTKKRKIIAFIDTIIKKFDTMVMPVTINEAKLAGDLQGFQKKNGHNMTHSDAAIVGTCLHLNAALVTRNAKDFKHSDILILNPFT